MKIDWTEAAHSKFHASIDGHNIVMSRDKLAVRIEVWDLTGKVYETQVVSLREFDENQSHAVRAAIVAVIHNLNRQLAAMKLPQAKVTITDPPSRHLRRVLFSVDALVAFLSSIEAHRIQANGLPYGTRVVTVNFDRDRQIFDILVEHPNFSITEPGEVIPTLPGVMFEIVRAE